MQYLSLRKYPNSASQVEIGLLLKVSEKNGREKGQMPSAPPSGN
jgi:hypothetical protein